MSKKTYNQKTKKRWRDREDKKRIEKQRQTEKWNKCVRLFGCTTDTDIDCACGLFIRTR